MNVSQNKNESPPIKRCLNRSALLISVVGFAIIAGAGYQWYRISLKRNAKALYDYAEQCAEKKDYATAATQFGRFVQLCPSDAAARVRLAETYDIAFSKLGQTERATELYREAIGVAPEEKKSAIHARLGDLLLRSRQFVAAVDEADAILKLDAKNSSAAGLRAKALYGQAMLGTFKGKPSDVGTSFEAALSLDPGDRDLAVAYAQIYRDEPQYLPEAAHDQRAVDRAKAADQIIDKLVATHPEQSEVYLARYEYRLQYHLAGADDDLNKARRLGRENVDVLLMSGEALRREAADAKTSADKARSLREAARGNYEKVVTVAANDYRGYYGLGETHWELGQSQAAIDAWKRGIESAPAATSSFEVSLAAALLSIDRFDEAEKYLNQLAKIVESLGANKLIIDKSVSDKSIFTKKYQLLRARWFRGKNQPFQAIALAHAVATGTKVTPQELGMVVEAWSLLGDVHMAIGRWLEAGDAYEKAADSAPNALQHRTLAAVAWNAANHPDRAIRNLRLVLAASDRPEIQSEVRLELATSMFRQTIAAPETKRDWQALQAATAEARAAHSKQPLSEPWRLAFLEADIARARADAEGRHADGVRESVTIYQNSHLDEKAPQNLLPVIAMAYERLELHEDADRIVAQWEKNVAAPEGRMLRAQVLAGHKQYGKSRALVEASLSELPPAERFAAQRFLVQISLAQHDLSKTHADLDAVSDFGPRDLDLLFAYAKLAEEQNQSGEVERCRQKFIEIEGPASCYAICLTSSKLLADAKSTTGPKLSEAREMIEVLTRQSPEWPPAMLLRARLLDAEGRSGEAISAYGDAIAGGASSVNAVQRLIDLLTRAGRTAEADAYLDSLRIQSFAPDVAEASKAKSRVGNVDRTKALALIHEGGSANREQARQILSDLIRRPDANITDALTLAKLEEHEGRIDQARAQYAVVASTKDPSAEQLAASADFLLRRGPAEEADVQIGRLEKLSADATTALALRVRFLHVLKRDAEIAPLLEAAAKRRENAITANNADMAANCLAIGALYESCEQYPAAERWYRRLMEAQPDNFQPLAIVLAKQKRGREAVSVCLDASKHATPSRPAMVICALRATGQIDEKEYQTAAALIAAAKAGEPAPQFLVMLGAALIAQDRLDEATQIYRQALAADPSDIRALNNLATLLVEQAGHTKESLELIDRAIKLAGPQDWLLETKGQIVLRDGRVDEALELLKEAATSAEPDPRMLLHLADAFRLAGKVDQARKALDEANRRKVTQQLLTPTDRQLVKELSAKLGG